MNKLTKVLYVDDEEINIFLFEMNFSKKHKVATASNGMEGLATLEADPNIEVVISDMQMPGLNGVEFIKKAKEKFPSKKYYMLTGFGLIPEIQESLDSGLIIKCFHKPFNFKELDSEIGKHTNNS